MTLMTDPDTSASQTLIKTDSRGRMHTPPQRREMLLGEFERSGMSAPQFAAMVGVKYQTFAGWRLRRAKGRRTNGSLPVPATSALRLVEAMVAPRSSATPDSEGLVVHLPGPAKMELNHADQLPLVCALLNSLENSRRSC